MSKSCDDISRRRMLLLMWCTYASYYLCRVNIGVAVPVMEEQLGWSKSDLGLLMSLFFLLYACGQVVHGMLGSIMSPRLLVAVGLFMTGALNVFMPAVACIPAGALVIWALNGYVQSMGWGPVVRLLATWVPGNERGTCAATLGTSYIVGAAVSTGVAVTMLLLCGWRWVFWAPGVMCPLVAALWLTVARDRPVGVSDHVYPPGAEVGPANLASSFKEVLVDTCRDLRMWYAGIALCGVNVVRYGFLSWAPTYILDTSEGQGAAIVTKMVAFPISGVGGALAAGWLSDHLRSRARAPVALSMLLGLSGCCAALTMIPRPPQWIGLALLMGSGVCAFGPHVLLVAALPADAGARRASAMSGAIDALGYAGAATTGWATGLLVAVRGWSWAFGLWNAGALLASVATYLLWWQTRSARSQSHIRDTVQCVR